VFAAASDPAVNRRVKIDAREAGVLCNLAQQPQDGDFILPSLVRQGDLVLSISTSGASPALAKHLRQRLETQFGPEYAMLLRLLKGVRRHLIDAGHDPDGHRRLLVRLVDGPLLEWLKSGDTTAIDELLEQELGLSGGLAHLMALTPDD
jgi:precorrin-2 dehydrogenase/sirohydrochlorin ferrochelatase